MGGVGGLRCFPGGWAPAVAAKACDYCKVAPAAVFCRVDGAFMCMACDMAVHAGAAAAHERVWVCEVCEQAPASVTCKADAAALCVTCDHDIHSANPLAQRHERFPVSPFYDSAAAAAAALRSSDVAAAFVAPVILPPEIKSVDLSFSDSDPFLDFDYPPETNNFGRYDSAADSIVPVKPSPAAAPITNLSLHHHNRFEIDFTTKSYNAHSHSHSVSSSSMDAGVVPEGSSASEISYNVAGGGVVDLSSCGTQLVGKDREARVLRYREKRKNRKFEKTIRYASRKAYAETRPRIKGRFAKRTEPETDIDAIFSADFAADHGGYGVVPSF